LKGKILFQRLCCIGYASKTNLPLDDDIKSKF